MKVSTVMVTGAAVAALCFGAVGSAAAQPLGHPGHGRPASPPQINGPRLAKGLLPPSAFGSSYTFLESLNSGSKLQTTRASRPVPRQSCAAYENDEYVSFLGQTAGATDQYMNEAWRGSWPDTLYGLSQDVVQFATDQAASTYFGQAYAKYAACLSFTVPNPGDVTPGGGTYLVSGVSISRTTVSGHHAFTATELWAPSEASGRFFHVDVLFVVAGTNVYNLWEVSGTNDVPSSALMTDLIHRVQALYP